jgi:serine/threonine protein kinase
VLAFLIHSDLKPENCLLDADGHVRISDFGLAGDLNAESDGTTVGSCGTNGYISREALANMPYSFEPDVYAYGVTMYELLHGQIPDAYDDPALLNFNPQLSDSCVQLLTALLAHDPAHRIGCDLHARERWNEVKEHAFFSGLDWNLASRRGLTPPFRPEANIANCDPLFELEDQLAEKDERQPHTHESTTQFRAVFRGWDYHTAPRFHTQRSQLRHRRADGSSGGGEEEGEEDTASGTPSRERMDLGDGVPVVPGAGGRSNAVSSGLEEVTIDADSIEMTAREQRRQPVSIQPSVIDATARPTAPSSPSTPIKDQLSSSPAPAASPEALHFASAAGDILDASEAHPSETKIVKRQSHMAGGSIPSRGWPSAIFHASDPPSRRSQSEFHTAASSAESAAPHVMSAPLRSNRLQATSSMDLDEAALDQITMDVDDRYDPESRVEEVPGLFD